MADKQQFRSAPVTWGKMPLLLPLVAVLVGVLSARAFGYPLAPWFPYVACGSVLAASLLYLVRGRFLLSANWMVATTMVALFSMAFWRASTDHLPNRPDYFAELQTEDSVLGGEVLRIRAGEKSLRLEVKVASIYKDAALSSAAGRLLVYLPPGIKAASVNVGDRIIVRQAAEPLRPPANPHTFDSRAYWATQGVYHRIYVSDDRVWRHLRSRGWGLTARAEKLRRRWFKSFQRYLSGNELAVASALVFGKKDLLTTEVRSAYSDTGAMHVLAVSGLHVGIILLIFRSFFRWLPGRDTLAGRLLETAVTVLAIWGFAYVSGLSPSVRRAAIMFSIVALGRLVLRQNYLLNTLLGAAIIMLIIEPAQVAQIGFQLSFMALVGIIWFATPLQRSIPGSRGPWKAIKSGVAASIGAQLGTLPVALYTFKTFPLYFMLSGSAVVIFAYLAMCLGIVHGGAYALFGFGAVTDVTGWALSTTVGLQNAFIYACAQLPGGVLELRHFTVYAALACALAVGALAYWINFRNGASAILASSLITLTIILALPRVRGNGERETVTVYHLSRQTLIDWTDGEKAVAFGDAIEPETIDFQVAPNRKQSGYEVGPTQSLDTLKLLDLGGVAFSILDGRESSPPTSVAGPFVLVRNGFKPKLLAGLPLQRGVTFIIDGSNPPWLYDDWAEFEADRDVNVWITGVDGAFIWRPRS